MKHFILIGLLFFTFCASSQTIRVPLHELESSTQGNQIGVGSDGDQYYYSLAFRSGDTIVLWNPLTHRFELTTKSTFLSGYPSGSGTTNTFPLWSSSTTLGNSQLTWNATYSRFEFGGTGAIVLPNRTTAQRSSVPTQGEKGWNTTSTGIDFYNGTRWAYIPESTVPRFTSTRIPYADANGQLTEDADLTFTGGNLLTATTIAGAKGSLGTSGTSASCDNVATGTFKAGTGAIEIALPTGLFGGGGSLRQWNVSFEVVATTFQANGGRLIVHISGDNTPSVYNISAYSITAAPVAATPFLNMNVRAGTEGSVIKIWIGELATAWGTTSIQIQNVQFVQNFGTGAASIAELCTGWSIAMEASAFGTVARTAGVVSQYSRITANAFGTFSWGSRDVNAILAGYANSSTVTGCYEITLPPTGSIITTQNVYFQVKGVLQFNSGNGSTFREFIIAATYIYSSRTFANANITWLDGDPGQTGSGTIFRFGDDGTRGKIWIGELAGTVSSNFIYLYDLTTATLNFDAHTAFLSGWTIGLEATAFDNVDLTVSGTPLNSIPYVSTLGHTYDANFYRNSTNFKAGNYLFNIDQTVGAGQDGYYLGYTHSSTELELKALPATYAGFTPAADSGSGSSVASGGTLTFTGGYGINTSVSGTTVTPEVDTGQIATQYDLTQLSDLDGIFSVSTDKQLTATQKVYRDSINDSFGLGYFSSFPFPVASSDYGLHISKNYAGEVSLYGDNSFLNLNERIARIQTNGIFGTNTSLTMLASRTDSISLSVLVDLQPNADRWFRVAQGGVDFIKALKSTNRLTFYNKYDIPNETPISTSGVKSIIQWQGDGSGTTPSFDVPTFFTQTANGSVTNTVTETTITASGQGTLTIPADYLEAGRTITIKATGYFTTDDAHTLQMRVKLGGATIGDASGITLPDLATGNEHWELEYTFTIRSVGASGTAIGQGKFRFCEGIGGTTTPCVESEMLNTSTFSLDTTTSNAIDVTAQWGTAAMTDNIVCTNLIIKADN